MVKVSFLSGTLFTSLYCYLLSESKYCPLVLILLYVYLFVQEFHLLSITYITCILYLYSLRRCRQIGSRFYEFLDRTSLLRRILFVLKWYDSISVLNDIRTTLSGGFHNSTVYCCISCIAAQYDSDVHTKRLRLECQNLNDLFLPSSQTNSNDQIS